MICIRYRSTYQLAVVSNTQSQEVSLQTPLVHSRPAPTLYVHGDYLCCRFVLHSSQAVQQHCNDHTRQHSAAGLPATKETYFNVH